ncbi:MAG TPA: hypothetical protein PLF70_00930 [Candidatus Portnoybacteria bacterium]|jgi:hypothetical protein|nr:hypothetical protein [Candidatus Portnoybacteria bacterium]MDD5752171.1 hypothetical protein [Candidatus Portnoybacteria bacterium]HNU96875.1 hypothetical protein [Candidatus Portnoybacteria bacterium]HOZ16433.1 hypothetical protein [Candidatus Portnoybacteria bacterium]HPH52135.1 hypothetical protein [Candidatus Portnoybacteria bacterium]
MKNYASKRANKGKTTYRTPSSVKYNLILNNINSGFKNTNFAKDKKDKKNNRDKSIQI